MKKHIATTIYSIILVLLLLPFANYCVFAQNSDTVTITKQYTSEDKDEKYEFDEYIDKGESRYKLGDVSYKIINEEPVTESVTKTVTDTVENLYNTSYTLTSPGVLPVSKTLTEGYRTYTAELTDIEYERMDTTARTKRLISELDLPSGNVPSTVDYEYYDSLTGQTVTYELPKISEKPSSKAKTVTEDFNVTFHQYDMGAVVINGKVITINETGSPVAEEYYPDIKAVSDYSDRQGDIVKLVWNGEPYTKDGEVCRNATATLSGTENLVTAYYSGLVELPVVELYRAILTYSADVEETTGRVKYTIEATARYDLAETEESETEPESEALAVQQESIIEEELPASVASAGIFIFVLAVVIILFLIATGLLWKIKH